MVIQQPDKQAVYIYIFTLPIKQLLKIVQLLIILLFMIIEVMLMEEELDRETMEILPLKIRLSPIIKR
jgi:hypothetical protein